MRAAASPVAKSWLLRRSQVAKPRNVNFFSSGPLDPDNLRSRMLKPLMRQVGAPWGAWHSLRHTYASLQLARGINVVQLSRALGHHSASFTLDTYVHLLQGEEAPPLDLTRELAPESELAAA